MCRLLIRYIGDRVIVGGLMVIFWGSCWLGGVMVLVVCQRLQVTRSISEFLLAGYIVTGKKIL